MKRVSLFLGHYGSGKTNIAANYAIRLRNTGRQVSLADIDIVNPYFRTKDWKEDFEKAGVELVALPFANTNLDLPAIPSEVYGLLQRRDRLAVFDIGGDDRGAYALGRFRPLILEEGDYDMFFVVNFLRPLTRTPQEAIESMREIEAAAGIGFTGIIHNTNLGAETTPELIERYAKSAAGLSELSGLPLRFTTVDRELHFSPAEGTYYGTEGIFPITIKRVI